MATAKKAAKKVPAKKVAKKATKKTAKKAPAKKAAKKTAKKAPAKKAAKKTAKKATKKTAKKTAKKATKRTAVATASTANVVVSSKVKESVRDGGIRMSSDFPEALNGEVQELITKAIARAKENGRGTVRPGDL